MIAEKSLLKKKLELQAAAEELKAAAEELRLETEIAKSRAREEVYATIDAEETSLLSGTPLMKSTPLSLYIMQASGGITSNVDDTTECNETKHHEATTKDYETKHHEATAERNETKHHEATTKDYETKHHEATAERNETKHHEATTKDYETKHHEATAERNETKHHEATAERNETKHHEATTKDYETKHHEATVERNETKHHEATTERNEAKHHEATTKDYETKCHDTITEQLKSPPDNVSTNHNDGNQDDATTKVNERRRGEKVAEATGGQLVNLKTQETHCHSTNVAKELTAPYYESEITKYDEMVGANVKDHRQTDLSDVQSAIDNGTLTKKLNETQKPNVDKETKFNETFTTPGVHHMHTSSPLGSATFTEQAFASMMTTQLEQHKQMISSHQEMAAAMTLPQPKIPTFKGAVIEYKAFMMAFDSRIKPKTTNNADRLYYLQQHLEGEAKDLIEGCLHLDPDEGYNEARKLLDKEYGDPYKISVAYINRLLKWPSVKYDDATGLKRLSLFLVKCMNAMKTINYMETLNHSPNMQAIVHKLPSYLQSKWREQVLNIKAKEQRIAKFKDIVKFIERAAETSNDPIYSKEALSKLDDRPKNTKSADEKVARCYTRHEIPVSQEQIPTPKVVSKFDNLRTISKKIPELIPDVDVGVLIGSNCPLALEPLEVLPSGGKGPFAMRLRHGWTVSGPLHIQPQATSQGCNATSHRITVQELESIKEVITPQSVMTMFELDFNDHSSTSDDSSLSQEDKEFLSIADQGTRRVDGHYELPLPFRDPNVVMPNNRVQAEKRAGWQRKKMLRNDEYHRDYTNFINTTIAKGYTRKVPKESTDAKPGKVWYLPHHGVYHPQKPNKIRVVFDCSAKHNGVSLNDKLIQGPNLTNSLVGVLTRFRQNPIAFMADIEAMFHQVRIPENQYDFLRFLWWPDGNLDAELQEYQMTVHLFGAVSSPSSANYALRKICDDNESEYDSEVTDTIKRNFYVDDCLRSVKTKATAIELVNDIRQACAQGGFNLTKFICNDRDVLESIPLEHRSKEVKSLDLECDDLPIERALGVQWCVETDIFQFKFRITVSNKPLTRRGILSTVSSIYDPLGILSPFTLVAKKLLQELCCEKAVGWDAEIPEHYLVRWDKWQRELPLLEQLILNRCLTPSEFGEIISQQVHVFSDASSTGYGAVAYLRQCDNENRTHCAFLMGKARLAPIKTMTIPRLELTAATVSTRMGHLLKSELDENPSFTYHTDSTTGTLRVGGRLSRANLPPHSVHPIILPRENHVTALIIKEAHKILGHTGRGHVLSRLRERYWIISANAAVRHVLSKCVICRRSRGKPNQQKMADLPKERVTPAPPFTFTGVDYFGPYIIKTGRKEVKRYGALFTCLASRAVHIEIANSLETDSFIQALRRFIARRGPVRTIRSDNGTNFVGAQAELRQAIKEMDHGQIRDKLRKQEIDWIFNPPAASHMGGVWERQIQTTRKVLAGLLQEHGNRLDDESLRTLMCEVEAVINSRPLTFISNDIDDLEPLTPSHLLTTKSAVIVPPPGNFQKGDVYMKRRWRRVQYLTNLFWTRWKKEYLVTLQQRHKWQNPGRNLTVGDVVIIKDENASRNSWSMGVIVQVEPDAQGLVRSAVVRTQKTELRRPANKLVVLLAKEEQ
ncbi:hypothetical protein QZH41_003649 [Actinostola sp. cb2023]|nr:hypothetical protein QZH41_003649 [Actinostola sp. cb2023]